MAPRPSSSGISRSIVTASGSCWCTLRTASSPSRAVATTRNSPSPPAPPSTSLRTRRSSALSSTTRTLGRRSDDDGIGAYRPDLDASVGHVEPHRPPPPPPHPPARHRGPRPPPSLPRPPDVALAPLGRGRARGSGRGHAWTRHPV